MIEADREQLMDAYRAAWRRSHGSEHAPTVLYSRGWYAIITRFETKVRERELRSMTAELERRAKEAGR